MSIHIRANKGVYADSHQEFVCDYLSDVANLPVISCVTGSTAFVIDGGIRLMLNGEGKWVQLSSSSSSSSGGGTVDESNIATDEEVEDMLNDVFS